MDDLDHELALFPPSGKTLSPKEAAHLHLLSRVEIEEALQQGLRERQAATQSPCAAIRDSGIRYR